MWANFEPNFNEMKNRFVRRFINYVLNGLLIALPVFGTAYIIYKLFIWLDGLLPGQWKYPGIGILILIVVLAMMGWLGSLLINDRIKGFVHHLIERVPGIGNLYKTINDILSAFVGSKKRFNQPVLVKVSEQLDMEMIGFITDTDLTELGQIDGKVAVYFPMSYSFAGHLVVVPIKNIKRIERNPVDVMKYTVSGGVVEFDEHKD